MKNKYKTKALCVCLGILFLFFGNFKLKAQCEFSDFEFIKITAGTDAVFQVKSIPNYQPIYTWDYSAAPSGVHFLNPLPGAIQIEVDPFLESTSFWLSYSYEDIDCMISDSIQIQVIGIDVFDTANGNHLLCASDLGSPLDIQTDLDFVDLAFDILDENGILLFQQLVEWPAGLTTGDYILDVSWQDLIESCPLCLILSDNTMQIPIYVNLDNAVVLSCNDNVQVSLNENCTIDPILDVLLEGGEHLDIAAFEYLFYDGPEAITSIGDAHLGLSLDFVVEEICTGNSCWGTISIEDKIAPEFEVQDIDLNVFCGSNLNIPSPTVWDNCNGSVQVNLVSSTVQTFDCTSQNGLIEQETRIYKATDVSGNESANFEQNIYTRIPVISDIEFPANLDDVQLESLNCAQADYTDPAYTGYPSAFGIDFIPETDYCGISSTYSDIFFSSCGNGFTVLRTWVILRSCSSESEFIEHSQLIYVKDKLDPLVDCPGTLEVGINTGSCMLENWLLDILVLDDCSTVDWTVTGADWMVMGGEELPNLPLGIHSIVLTATDDCDNQTNCNTELVLVDALSPTAICTELVEVSLNSEGIATVDASSIDNGSFDNCTGNVTFQLRRMDGIYGESVVLDCEDLILDDLQLELSVVDVAGNSNSCMVDVSISDKIGPVLNCPSAEGFDCEDIDNIIELWPEVSFSDNCVATVNYGDLDDTGLDLDCYTGIVQRLVSVVDDSGNEASCTQVISFEGTSPLVFSDIEWPEDLFFESCAGVSFDPDSIGLDVGQPEVVTSICGLVGVNYTDQLFYTGGAECFKVIRTWTVMDWCHFDASTGAGIFDHVQEIRVQDDQAPIVDCDIVPFVKLNTPDCFGEITFELPFIIEECSDQVDIDVSSVLGSGVGPFQDVGLGNYMVTYTISDACGNVTNCLVDYQVSDAGEPTAYCIDQLVIDLPEEQEVDIVASSFDFASFDNCTQEDLLIFAFSALSFDSIRTFDCSNLGVNPVDMYVFDAEGNFDRCSVSLLLQDNNNFCGNSLLTLSGQVLDVHDDPIGEVQIKNSGVVVDSVLSDNNGIYSFNAVSPNGDFTLSADYLGESSIEDNVTTFDMVLITRHILGQELLASPYLWIAADVNDSGTISTLDLVAIRKVILQIEQQFPNGKQWKFVDRSYVFQSGLNPLLEGYPEVINLNNLDEDQTNLDFVAIRMGDVN